jgi:hypothetical protein
VYRQLPIASAVTVTVRPAPKSKVTVALGRAVPLMVGLRELIVAPFIGAVIVTATRESTVTVLVAVAVFPAASRDVTENVTIPSIAIAPAGTTTLHCPIASAVAINDIPLTITVTVALGSAVPRSEGVRVPTVAPVIGVVIATVVTVSTVKVTALGALALPARSVATALTITAPSPSGIAAATA